MSSYKVEKVHESVMNVLGMNIFWCKDTNTMMWCDVQGGQIMKMDLTTNKMNLCKILGEPMISFCIPIQGKKDQFIVGAGQRLLLVHWDCLHTMGQIVKVLCEVPGNGIRLNQCKVDKQGRLLFGTMMNEDQGDFLEMQKRVGALYCFTMSDGLVLLKDNIGMGSGMVWNNNCTKMFFIDSFDFVINEFDYDLKMGIIGNQLELRLLSK